MNALWRSTALSVLSFPTLGEGLQWQQPAVTHSSRGSLMLGQWEVNFHRGVFGGRVLARSMGHMHLV